jgi:hypothetical protein
MVGIILNYQEVKYHYTANISTQSKPRSHSKTKINMEEIEADIVAEQASVHWRSYGIYTIGHSKLNKQKIKIYKKDNTFASFCISMILYVQASKILIKMS